MDNTPGHWFCDHCRKPSEPNLDREQAVCSTCHYATLKWVPDISPSTVVGRIASPEGPPCATTAAQFIGVRDNQGKRVTPERAHQLFDQIRNAIQ